MDPSKTEHDQSSSFDPKFDQLVFAVSAKLEAGERIDIDQIAADNPDHAERLRKLLPTLLAMNDLGHVCPRPNEKDASPSHDVDVPTSGLLGDFRILREIGRGGMGVVYEAEQISLNRRVALKILPLVGVLDNRQLQRFKNEALAAAQLDHPNIVDVLGVGCERSVHYYAMRLIEGRPLNTLISLLRGQTEMQPATQSLGDGRARDGNASRRAATSTVNPRRPPETISLAGSAVSTDVRGRSIEYFRAVATMAAQVAAALDFAHQQGIVHRDVKPGNLIIDANGEPWITDFGLAQIEATPGLTLTGDVVGTLRYMSPEQALAKRVVVDHRTDVYSLGITLYELATLQQAFPDQHRQELMRKIAFEEPMRPRQLCKSMPIELETIIRKSIAKNPSDRYSTAAEMADDLHRFLDDEPIRARRPSPLDLTVKWARRHRTAVIWCFVLLLTISFVSSLSAIWLAAKNDKLVEAEREKKQSLWEAYLAQAHATRRSGQAGQRFDSLRSIRKATQLYAPHELSQEQLLNLRNEAIAAMALPDIQAIGAIDLHSRVMTLDDQFEHLAVIDSEGTIRVHRVADEQPIVTLPLSEKATVSLLAFSPDQRYLAAKYQLHADAPARTRIWSLEQRKVVLEFESRPRSNMQFSHDGKLLAAILRDGSLKVFDIENQTDKATIAPVGPQRGRLKFSPDDTRVAVAFLNSPQIHIHDLTSGRIVHKINNRTVTYAMDWHPSGKFLAAGGPDFMIRVWSLAELSRPMAVLRGHQAEVVAVSFLQNGSLLATRSHDGTLRLWDALAGWQRCFAMGRFIRFDREGRRFARHHPGDKGVEIWQVAAANEMQILVEHRLRKGPYSVDISPDGRSMVSSGTDGVWFWDLRSGQTIQRLPIPGRTAHFHRDQLVTVSEVGVLTWPLEQDEGRLKIGPPRRLASVQVSEPVCRAAISRANETLMAIVDWSEAVILDLRSGSQMVSLKTKGVIQDVALSHNGRWAVTAGSECQVWDARSGELVTTLGSSDGYPSCQFSPNSDSLVVVTATEFRIFETGSWHLAHHRPIVNSIRSPIAFSSDGRLLAMAESRYRTQLLDTRSWQQLAILETQFPRQPSGLVFTPDNAKLIVASETHEIHVWDLRMIQSRLQELNLDWQMSPPSQPVIPMLNHDVAPLEGRVEFGPAWDQWHSDSSQQR